MSKMGFLKSVSVNCHIATFECKTVAVDCPVLKIQIFKKFQILKCVIKIIYFSYIFSFYMKNNLYL